MENLIKALSDEIDFTRDAIAKMRAARNNGRRALELEAESEVQMQLAKLDARISEIRRKLGL